MNYVINASSVSNQDATVSIKEATINFGTTVKTAEKLPNPAELFLSSFAACMLKNVERFSTILKFNYTKATVNVTATRLEKPPRIDNLNYNLTIYSNDKKMNTQLLKKNIEKFGTIYNTVQQSCTITGTIKTIENV